jgi:vesicle-associated membrane protein 7
MSNKPIIFACIAERDPTSDTFHRLVGEYAVNDTKLGETVKVMIPRIQQENHRRTLTQSIYHFHYKVSGLYLYLCVAGADYPMRVCFNFLDDIETKYLQNGTKAKQLLRDRVTFFNDPRNDKITSIHSQIDDVKNTMIENIDKILERGETLENLMMQTDELGESAATYRRTTNKVKWSMRKRLVILVTILILILLVVIFIIVWAACGLDFGKCKVQNKE